MEKKPITESQSEKQSDKATKRIIFKVFFSFAFCLLALIWVTGIYFKDNTKDMLMIQLFLYGAFSALLGGKIGGYLGAVMEEDTCSTLDMGVLSSMGSLAVNLAFPLMGTAVVGFIFILRWDFLWLIALFATLCLLVIANRFSVKIKRIQPIDFCGWRVDSHGKRLSTNLQPMRMKNRLAIILGLAGCVFSILTVYMAVLMRSGLWNAEMLGAMMYAMSGAGLGGMVSGWLAGMLDEHTGEPEHDNPIMISSMALMASMMGAMPASMLGGMMSLMGINAILPTLAVGVLLLLGYYVFLFRGHFRVSVALKKKS